MWIAYGVVAVAAVVAAFIDSKIDLTIKIGADFVVFSVFYIVAQATERLVEPWMNKVKAEEVKTKKEAAKKATQRTALAVKAGDTAEAEAAAADESRAHEDLAETQGERAVIAWAMASVFALVACGLLGLGLIEAVADVTGSSDDVAWFRRADVVLTGLAVGAGTKPLHDLISRLEKAKQNADPAT
jgi:hypothetical protein